MKRFARIMLPVVALLLTITALGLLGHAEEAVVIASGTEFPNMTWTLDSEGLLTIAGEGPMPSIGFDGVWKPYVQLIKKVVIQSGITSIGDGAFSGCISLVSVSLPDTVTGIDAYAFSNCSSLREITIPEGVAGIGCSAFSNCSSLVSVSLPDTVTGLDAYAFYGCSSLREITIPEGVTSIGDYTFFACGRLSKIVIPSSVTSIGEFAFYQCSVLRDTFYALGEDDWQAISTASDNEDLLNCRIHWFATDQAEHWGEPVITPATTVDWGFATYTCACGYSYEELLLRPEGEAEQTPAISDNQNGYDYTAVGCWTTTINSSLTWESGGYTRAEQIDTYLVVERYDEHMQFISRRDIPLDLPVFGGVFLCEDYNFVVTGRINWNEDDSLEVIRVTCYTKDWERVGAAGLSGVNTFSPFDSGCLRFARIGDMLYVRTAHRHYKSPDGLRHQSNMSFAVDIPSMLTDDPQISVQNIYYVSHSFNQFILADGTDLITLDQGDAWPRAIVLSRYNTDMSREDPYGSNTAVTILKIADSTASYNFTGVALGGLEYSDTHYLVAGNTASQAGGISFEYNQRNVFIATVPKDNLSDEAVSFTWITHYEEGADVDLGTPHFIKLDDGRFFLMWSAGNSINGCFISADGKHDGICYVIQGTLSDCLPVQVGDHLVWYATKNFTPKFYTVDLRNPGAEITMEYGPGHVHEYCTSYPVEPTCNIRGYTVYVCNCGYNYYTYDVDPLGHDCIIQTIAPTCTQEGYTLRTCSRCKLYDAYDKVPALGHGNTHCEGAEEATCMVDGYTGDVVCDDCGEILESGETIPATGEHTYGSWTVIAKPTEEKNGLRERSCIHCGHMQQEVLEAGTGLPGDVNGDGSANARDVRALLQFLADLLAEDAPFDSDAADMDGNGKVNARDVRALLQALAGLQ